MSSEEPSHGTQQTSWARICTHPGLCPLTPLPLQVLWRPIHPPSPTPSLLEPFHTNIIQRRPVAMRKGEDLGKQT